MNFKIKQHENKKYYIHAYKEGTGTINPRGANSFHYKNQNMFISEYKNNNSLDRKFVISIRLDGRNEHKGKCRLTQMNFNEIELMELRNQIDNLLNANENSTSS